MGDGGGEMVEWGMVEGVVEWEMVRGGGGVGGGGGGMVEWG